MVPLNPIQIAPSVGSGPALDVLLEEMVRKDRVSIDRESIVDMLVLQLDETRHTTEWLRVMRRIVYITHDGILSSNAVRPIATKAVH